MTIPLGGRCVQVGIIPIEEFAEAMRRADGAFAERVGTYAARFGEVTPDTLAVLAQAAYLCWFEAEFESDLLETCRAVDLGRPTSLYLCGQVSPARWVRLNEYAVALQRWLGSRAPLPDAVDPARVETITSWLGRRQTVKAALATALLSMLVNEMAHRVSLSRLAAGSTAPTREYADFSAWYGCPDEAEACAVVARWAGGHPDAAALVNGLRLSGEPACHCRWLRHLDIQVSSIGAMEWRGALPPDTASKERKRALDAGIAAGFEAWLAQAPPASDVARRIHHALGTPTPAKRAVVSDFLCQPPPGAEFYAWVTARTEADGLTPAARFGMA